MKFITQFRATPEEVSLAANSIWIRFLGQDEFSLLIDRDGNTFTHLVLAIENVREEQYKSVELATFEQALLNNGEWDNF